MKPHVFIGSSSEGLPVAYALQNNLDEAAEVTVWKQDVFRPSEFILESLLKQLDQADLGVFVFSPDDLLRIRGEEQAAVRDNVVFEFGLFVGRLGRAGSIIVAPRGGNPRLPSDLLGVNVLTYYADREDGNLDAALGPASNKIRALLQDIQPKADALPAEFERSMIERRDQLTGRQRDILRAIEAKAPCSKEELAEIFSDIPASELTYRLEQLRLLMFISAQGTRAGGPVTTLYSLSEAYKYELRHKAQSFRTN